MDKKDKIDTRNQKKWQNNAPTTLEEWEDYKIHGAFITSLSTREIDQLINSKIDELIKELSLLPAWTTLQEVIKAIRDSKE